MHPPADLAALYRDHVAGLRAAYTAVLAATGWDAVVLYSGTPRLRSQFDDQFWPLRPLPHLQHWLPLAETDCALVIQPEAQPVLHRLSHRSYWEAPAPLEAPHVWPEFDVRPLAEVADLAGRLPRGRVAVIAEEPAQLRLGRLAAAAHNPPALLAGLDALRVHKSAYEVACLAAANRRAALGHEALRAAFSAGEASEFSLHLAFLQATAQDDAETPYKNIVATGSNAATLHHIAYGRTAKRSDSLLVDAGATCFGYAADVTRTWWRGGGADSDAFGALVAGVEDLQQGLCAEVAIGMPFEDLHDRAHERLTQLLCELGLLRCSPAEAMAAQLSRTFLPHGLGHSLGLQCHDVGCALVPPKAHNPWLRNTSVIAEGQVFTIEPGVYFIPLLLEALRAGPQAHRVDWKLVAALQPFGGVRIEDDLWVQAAGVRNLTREVLPRGGGRLG